MNKESFTDLVKTSLYNSIVDITNDEPSINYDSIESIINLSIDMVASFSWLSAVDFVRDEFKKSLKENKKDEIPDV